MSEQIYFDCSATTKPYDECLNVFTKISSECFANSASSHALGSASLTKLEQARKQVAKYLNCKTDEVIFTSGATEGNNLAIRGVAERNKAWANRIITTKGEHPSVMNVFKELEKEGYEVVYLDYDREGSIDLNGFEASVDSKTSLVSIMGVNNETGYVFDTKKAYRIVKSKNKRCAFHSDITQAVGKEDLSSFSYDLATFSGHKIGGLKGSGALIKKENVLMNAQILGGGQENGYRSGTSTLAMDCSLATALRISLSTLDERRKNASSLNRYLRDELSKVDEIEIVSPESATPFILNIAFKRHKGSVVFQALSDAGIYVSTKSACSSREEGYSYVIRNAGFDERIAKNAIRLSFCGNETLEQGNIFIDVLKDILRNTKEEN